MFDNLLGFGYENIFQSSRDLHTADKRKSAGKPIDIQAAAIKFFGLQKIFEFNQKTK